MSLIDVIDLSFAYEGSYDEVFQNVSFQIDTTGSLDLLVGMVGERQLF